MIQKIRNNSIEVKIFRVGNETVIFGYFCFVVFPVQNLSLTPDKQEMPLIAKQLLLSGEVKYRRARGSSIAAIARSLRISWAYCKKLLLLNPAQSTTPKARRVAKHLLQRRANVRRLALQVKVANHATYPVYPSASVIGKKIGVSKSTVLRDLHRNGLVSRVRKCHSCMEPRVRAKRVAFAKEWLRRPLRDLKDLVFTDEHVCNLNDNSARSQWVQLGQTPCLRERKSARNATPVLVWGAVGWNYRKLIVLHNKKRRYRRGRPNRGEIREAWEGPYRLTSEKYIRDVLCVIRQDFQGGRILQQDGARSHVSQTSMKWLRRQRVPVVENWPPYSPHLSPVENCWALLNRYIADQHPRDVDSLIAAARTGWNQIPQETINRMILSFRGRLEETVRRRGL